MAAIDHNLEQKGWSIVNNRLHKEFSFPDFLQAFSFMTRVADAAEKLQHHPDWFNSYNKVVIDLFSHDKKTISENDYLLAKTIETLQ